jgi:ABC-type Fe3+ transport system permease subunit
VSARVPLVAFAVLGAPLAWVAQLVLSYSFEEAGCAPGDGREVWGIGVRSLHIAVGAAAFAVAAGAVLAALAMRRSGADDTAVPGEGGFLAACALAAGVVFALTIVLTGVGASVLGTCRQG